MQAAENDKNTHIRHPYHNVCGADRPGAVIYPCALLQPPHPAQRSDPPIATDPS